MANLIVIYGLIWLFLAVAACCIISELTEKYGRNDVWWIFLGIIMFPIALIFLLVLGETKAKYEERIKHEAEVLVDTYIEKTSKQ